MNTDAASASLSDDHGASGRRFPDPSASGRRVCFLLASTREPGHTGNTEWLARQAAAALPAGSSQQWLALASMNLPPFVDQRHTVGQYPMPEGDLRRVLDGLLDATDIVLVAPVYWYSLPATVKLVIDHWSAWLRVPGLDFKARMAAKTLWLVSTSGDRAKAQPMIDSVALCAQFMGMRFGGALWGKGGPPHAVEADTQALAEAAGFFAR